MTTGDLRARYEMLLGEVCEAPKTRSGKDCVSLDVNLDTFRRLAKHWAELPATSRPRLRGISFARRSEGHPALVLVLDAGGRAPFFVVSAATVPGQPLPRLSKIWPYASWWEEELQRFSESDLEGESMESGARWLPR